MKPGLIAENIFERSVLKELEFHNDYKCVAPGDVCAFFISHEHSASLSEMMTVPAVIAAINELTVEKIKAEAVNLKLMMPAKYSEEKMKKILREIQNILSVAGVKVAHFDGELVKYVSEPFLTASAIGSKEDVKDAKEMYARPGDDVVMIGCAGEAGASILSKLKRDDLLTRLSDSYLDGAVICPEKLLVLDEAALAAKSEDACCYHVSKGGIYAALWNMAKKSRVGLDIYLKDIPIKQETVEICNFLDLNPYELFSEGCLLVTISEGQELVNECIEKGFKAAVIGKITDSNDRVVIIESERKFLTPPCPDEIIKYL